MLYFRQEDLDDRVFKSRGMPWVRMLWEGSSKKVRSTEGVISRGHYHSHYLPLTERLTDLACWQMERKTLLGDVNSPSRSLMNILSLGFKQVTWKTRFLPNQNDRQSWFPVRKSMRCVKKLWFLRGKKWDVTQSKILLSMVLRSSFEWQLLRIQLCIWHAGIQNGSSVGGQEWIEIFDLNTHLRIFEYLSFFIA